MKEECDFFVGQKVWSIRCGWTKVTKIDLVMCRLYDKQGNAYTLAGRANADDEHPVLFYMDILYGSEPPCEFKSGDVVMVSDDFEAGSFQPALFYNETSGYRCFIGPFCETYFEVWKNCISIEEYKQLLTQKNQ